MTHTYIWYIVAVDTGDWIVPALICRNEEFAKKVARELGDNRTDSGPKYVVQRVESVDEPIPVE